MARQGPPRSCCPRCVVEFAGMHPCAIGFNCSRLPGKCASARLLGRVPPRYDDARNSRLFCWAAMRHCGFPLWRHACVARVQRASARALTARANSAGVLHAPCNALFPLGASTFPGRARSEIRAAMPRPCGGAGFLRARGAVIRYRCSRFPIMASRSWRLIAGARVHW